MKYAIALPLLLVPALLAWSALPSPAPAAPDVEHGRYLVHNVAMCIQCHTPRDASGHLIMDKLLQGEAVPISSPFKEIAFAFHAPHIAGLPGYPPEDAVKLLVTGATHNGGSTTPPMPPFRMTKADAEDVVAYLLTLK
jgi:mono/diheme cytochrome c family protein